ncbi:MAG TPA: class I SAM-dependent methyltransferase [Vicinamibacterales bacterium]|nr:class I SAM-dependent methyltransferase [Vicinamibacterales bacterium]
MERVIPLALAAFLCLEIPFGAFSQQTVPSSGASVPSYIPDAAARPILEAIPPAQRPAELRSKAPSELARDWPAWASARDRDIRARLAAGDEDSVFNLALFGTTFTDRPPLTERDIAAASGGKTTTDAVRLRIERLIDALLSSAGNERLEFARLVAGRQSIDFEAANARRRLREWLAAGTARVIAEYGKQADLVRERAVSDASRSTLFRDRGLSSDTSIYPGFGIEQALAVLLTNRLLSAGSVRRVGVVGPGLDFVDKRQGTDFYPVQTIQPFAIVDSVLRLGLAEPGQVRVTTFDVSPRVNHHLEVARRRAEAGEAYVLNLPRRLDLFPWSRYLVAYWEHLGDKIGMDAPPVAVPPEIGDRVRMRAVRVRPDVVQAIAPEDLDIVLQRMEPAPGARFDLIVATNVLVYYDVFEQSLALANVAAMLRPGGVFISNQAVEPLGGIPMESLGHVDIPMEDRPASTDVSQFTGDRFFLYRRR